MERELVSHVSLLSGVVTNSPLLTQMSDWWAHNWGNVASLVGLLLSVVVLMFSKRAASAARDTKLAILRRSAAQDLRESGEKIKFMKILCDSEIWQVAAFVGNGLVEDLTFLRSRWVDHFDEETQQNLNNLTTQLDTLNSQLRKFNRRQPKPSEFEALRLAMINISAVISAAMGRHESLLEK